MFTRGIKISANSYKNMSYKGALRFLFSMFRIYQKSSNDKELLKMLQSIDACLNHRTID